MATPTPKDRRDVVSPRDVVVRPGGRLAAAALAVLGTLASAAHAMVLLALVGRLRARAAAGRDRRETERGDVPGWVLVTLMTAGLVTTIWALAGPQLAQLFTQAIAAVTGPGGR